MNKLMFSGDTVSGVDDGKSTILIVEDEKINQMIISQILSNYELKLASNGIEALEIANQYAKEISVILLDLYMPELNGVEVLKRLKSEEKTKNIPVIVTTSQTEVEEEMLELGAVDFLAKPYGNPGVIRARVSNTIQSYKAMEQLMANTYDKITGLYNMRSFLSIIENEKEVITRAGAFSDYAMVYCNLTNFKQYNSVNGIEAGDSLLKQLGEVLQDIFPEASIARFSDDHFVLFAMSDQLTDRLNQLTMEFQHSFVGQSLHIKTGIRYLTKEDQDLAVSAVCDQAKIACDLIKHEAHKDICTFDRKLNLEIQRRNYIIDHFDEALEKEHIQIYLQPVVRSITGDLCGAEALVRWIDPKLGFLSPGEFIPILEDAHLISKLDCFVIRTICRQYRERIDTHRPVIPVSFNLSIQDFSETNICNVILEASDQYQVPRHLLNIEITESMLIKDSERMKAEIKRFHDLGFRVWMDDFGSGYSSLNILKDFDFDELKIDMVFLTSFTDKSKDIIRSIIRMAKEIGIQTLAEGVETEEQYLFLRNMGCEKIQGYYFGKPEPADFAVPNCIDRGMNVETQAWSEYYDRVGKVNFMDERAIAIFQDDGKNLHFLFANREYQKILAEIGTTSLEQAEYNMNASASPMHKLFRNFVDRMDKTGKVCELTYPAGTQFMSLKSYTIAECNGQYMYVSSLSNITRNADLEKQDAHEALVHNLLYLYDFIAVADYEKDTIENYDANQATEDIEESEKHQGIRETISHFKNTKIFPDDRVAYENFFDLDTLENRLMSNQDGNFSEYFRTKGLDGNYIWMVYSIMVIPKTNHKRFLIVARKAPIDDPNVQKKLLETFETELVNVPSVTEDGFSSNDLWKNLCRYSDVKFFWKDTNRQFVGVSRAFLNYYGLESDEQVIGKTDEDMRWHVSDGPFKNDEEDILTKGKYVNNAPGKCIIQGVLHNILAFKMPIYRDGKIIGLFGYFIDTESASDIENMAELSNSVDLVTRLANTRGLMDTFISYFYEYRKHNKDFTAIGIHVEGFDDFRQAYGDEIANQLLCKFAEILKHYFGNQATIGRLSGSQFIALYQNADQGQLYHMLDGIHRDIKDISEVDGHLCTCFPHITTSYATSEGTYEEMVMTILKNQMLLERLSFGQTSIYTPM